MCPTSSQVRLKWMKHVPEVEGTINEDLSEIRDPAEDDVQRKNRYFGILWRNGTVGAGVFDDVAADTLHTHLRKSFSRFCYLFRYPGRIHQYRFARLRPPSCESRQKTVQRWKRKSYQLSGGIPEILETKTVSECGTRREKSPLYSGESLKI